MSKNKRVDIDSPVYVSLAQKIAVRLGESDSEAIRQIQVLIALQGGIFIQECLKDVVSRIENSDFMMTDDKTRRRTPGGMFFKVAKNKMTSSQRWRFMAITGKKRK